MSNESPDRIRTERDGRILVVTLNRPQSLNALAPEDNAALADIFDTYSADDELWVAIITGSGERAFCSGIDLKAIGGGGSRKLPASGFAGLTGRYDLDKPIIAAVNGLAVGGGFELVLSCDIVIAAEHARFGLLEAARGTAALAGGLQRLPRQIGLKRAMDMILTARMVSASEGRDYGFVNEVVPASDLMQAARRKAERILQMAPLSVRASKRAALDGLAQSTVQAAVAAQKEMPLIKQLLHSEDRIEGARAFAENREPQWRNR